MSSGLGRGKSGAVWQTVPGRRGGMAGVAAMVPMVPWQATMHDARCPLRLQSGLIGPCRGEVKKEYSVDF